MFRFEEISPAVIARNLGGMFIGRKRESDFEACRGPLRTGHGDEQRMEIGAISLLGIASVKHVTVTPSCAGLVIAHGGENVVVDRSRLIQRSGYALGDFDCQVGGKPGDGHKFVGLRYSRRSRSLS